MLLHFWLDVAGRSEAGVRGLSLLFALLAIPALWWAGRAVWGTQKAAWIAAVLTAFNPFLAQYAQEARMYSLVALLAIPATVCFLRAYALDDAAPAAVDRRLRAVRRRRALHPQLADLLRLAPRPRVAGAVARRPARASCSATGCSASAAPSSSTCRGCRRRSTRRRTPARPWADAPAFDSLLGVPACCSGGCRRSCC